MKRAYWCFPVLLWATGCVATDVGNPQDEPSDAEIRVVVFEEEPDAAPTALSLSDGVEITHVWMAIDETRFSATCDDVEEAEGETETETESEEDEEVRQRELVVTDLVSGTSFPNPIAVMQPGTSFCAMRLRIRPVSAAELPAGAPAELAGYSMLVRGLRKDGTPFIVYANFDDELELGGEITLRTDAKSPFLIGFAANGWLPHRDLSPLPGDLIRIDAENHTLIYEAFRDAVSASPRLFHDDGDGILEPNEAERPIAVPVDD